MEMAARRPHLVKPACGTKVNFILQTLYQNVLHLEDWIRKYDAEGHLQSSLISEADQKGYKHLLETTLVAEKAGSKNLTVPVSFIQDSHQHELVTRCVQRVLHRDGAGNNVLSFGFGPRTDNPKASVSVILDLEYRYPNSSVNRLQYNVWKTLLSRIGDTLMCHLLENTSVFILLVKPAVFLQITGEPVYQLWPYSSSFQRMTKNCPPQPHSTTDSKVQGKQMKAGLSKKQRQKKKKASGKLLSCVSSSGMDKSTSSSVFESSYTSLKRKRIDDVCNESRKHRKLTEDIGSSESSSQLCLSDTSVTVVPETSISSAENVSADIVSNMETECGVEKCTLPKVVPMSKRQKKRLKEKRKEKRKKQQQKSKSCTPGSMAFRYHLYVPRLSLLYGKYLRERFPANFGLARFSPSEGGARSLFTDIFVQGNVGGNVPNNDQRCQCQETQSVPKKDLEEKRQSVNVSSLKSSRCDQKKPEQKRSRFHRPCFRSTNSTAITAQRDGVEPKTQSRKESGSLRQQHRLNDHETITARSFENTRPIPVSAERIQSLQTSSSSDTSKSSVGIYLIESVSSSQVSSASSSSVAISNPSTDKEGSNRSPPPVLGHPNSCVKGSAEDQASEHISMPVSTPEQPFPGNRDQERSVYTILRSSGEERGLPSKETVPASNDAAVKLVVGASAEEHQQNVDVEDIEQEDRVTVQEKEIGEPLENSPSPMFQKKVLLLLRNLLLNHRKCKYWAVLSHHCSSKAGVQKMACRKTSATGPQKGSSGQGKRGRRTKLKRTDKHVATAKLLEDYVPHHQVFAFLKRVLKLTVPVQLIGPAANMSTFLKNIRTLVSSGKFERICLGQLMNRMKVKGCEWLREVTCQREKEHHMAQLLWWLVVSFVLPVIRTFFYVTDTTTYRNRLFYYRKTTWLRLKSRAVEEFRKATALKPVSECQVHQLLTSGQSLGVSVLRFLPKVRSLRPIVNMSAKPRPGSEQKKSINKQLDNLFQVFTSEKALDEGMCGCSVFGMAGIHKKLRQFKEKRTAHQDNRVLYFVKSDIRSCFDSIQQHQLFQIAKDILDKSKEQSFMTRKFVTVYLAGKKVKRVFHHDTTRLSLYQPDFVSFLRQKFSRGKWSDLIVVDMAFFHENDSSSLLQILSSHLFNNIIRVGARHYLQKTGISQGSVMSTLLASIYLAHLEKTHLVVLEDELLIRRMDDYLFITSDKTRAEHFVHSMVNGFPDFNCFTSAEKILTNFPVSHPSIGAIKHIEQEGVFPWCGLMINTCSLELSVDYSRYSGLSITDTATFDASYKAGQTLSQKLLTCLKIKCHAIFFDLEVNSRERILLNVYQALLFVALTFHSFVIKLPPSKRLEVNPYFFISTIREIPSCTQSLVARNLVHAVCKDHFPIPLETLQWLSADAFLVRLHPYSGYKPLKKFLRAWKNASQKKMNQKDICALREVHRTAMQLDSAIVLFKRAP